MKFRIIRDYGDFQPQVWYSYLTTGDWWEDIGYSRCSTLEEARQVCADYKRMKEDEVVEEFEL